MNVDLLNWIMAKPLYERTEDELMAFVSLTPENDDHTYRRFRVTAYALLLARMGDARTEMPYLVWTVIMGPDIPPPTTFGRGMFPLIPDPKRFYNWN